MFHLIHQMFSFDMGIDLGTANTLVYVKGKGILLSEPSVVAIETTTNRVLAVGHEAKRMMGRTPGAITAIRPMRDGVIADFDTVERMIRYFINKAHNRNSLRRPRVVIGVPSGITEVERRAVRESAEQAGAREIILIQEALAAALGANIPIHEPAGNMVVDIGGGTTEIAVLSLGNMVVDDSIRVGGDEFDQALIKYMRSNYNLIIGERTAEEIKIGIGHAVPDRKNETYDMRGRDSITGLPRTLVLNAVEARKALEEPLNAILEAIKSALEKTPPELSADIVERGIVLTGGGSLLRGLDRFIAKETGVPVICAENPLNCVVIGTGIYLAGLDHKTHYL